MVLVMQSCFSRGRLFVTQCTVACQVPLSMDDLKMKKKLELIEANSRKVVVGRDKRRLVKWLVLFSVAELYWTLCDPMDCSTPGSPAFLHLLEFAQIHIH